MGAGHVIIISNNQKLRERLTRDQKEKEETEDQNRDGEGGVIWTRTSHF
jgi:hypothetical protein